MPQFEQFDPTNDGNRGSEEMKRLYENDLSAKKFSTKSYETTAQLPENKGLFGEADDKSAEEKIYEQITPEEVDENELELGKLSNDYLNGLGKIPGNLTMEQVRKSALSYRESLSPEKQEEEDRRAVNLIKNDIKDKAELKYIEAVDLKPNLMAQAKPNPAEPTRLNHRSLLDYITGRNRKV
jgi:hypothetical protein